MRILVVCNSAARIKDQLYFCESMARRVEHVRYDFLLTSRKYREYITQRKEINQSSILVDAVSDLKLRIRDRMRPLYTRVYKTTLFEVARTILACLFIYPYFLYVYTLVTRNVPHIVVLTGDRTPGVEQVILKFARIKKIPTILPYLALSDPEGNVKIRQRNKLYRLSGDSPLVTKLAMKVFRKQVYTHDTGSYIFYRPSEIITYRFLNTLSSNPWCPGNGLSDIVCVDTRHTFDKYTSSGVSRSKLRLTGDISFDRIHASYTKRKERREEINGKYGISSGKRIVLCALPQIGEHGICKWGEHFADIDYIVQTLSNSNRNLLISLHPRMQPEHYAYLQEKYACVILEERLADVLPIADIFVSMFSSTVAWAVMCGVPTIVIDFFKLNYSVFEFLTSICVIKEREILSGSVDTVIAGSSSFSEDWQQLSRDQVFDGRTIERYAALLKELCAAQEKG